MIAAAALVATPAAAEVRIGYIDSVRIFQEYREAQEAQARFDRQMQGWRDEASEKERSVQLLRNELRDQGPILSALRRQEKEEALQKALSDYERFVQSVWGPQGRAAAENERTTREIVEQIRRVVEKVAGEQAMDIVLDAAGGFIVFADVKMDITGEVLRELNEAAAPGATRR